MEEPIADEVRGIVDGHVVLSRALAARGHFPAIDVVQSLSRVMSSVAPRHQLEAAARVRQSVAAYEEKRDLIVLGAYSKGSDPSVDRAIAVRPRVESFLKQGTEDFEPTSKTMELLSQLGESC